MNSIYFTWTPNDVLGESKYLTELVLNYNLVGVT